MKKSQHLHQGSLDKFENWTQIFELEKIQFNPQQQQKEQSLIFCWQSFFPLYQAQIMFRNCKIKSSYLFLILLLIACSYSKVMDIGPGPQTSQLQMQLETQVQAVQKVQVDVTTCEEFKIKNKKKYSYSSQSEDLYRCMVFKKNQKKVNDHNFKKQRKFNQAINHFADLTAQQFMLTYTTTFASNQNVRKYANQYINMENAAIAQQNGQEIDYDDGVPTLNQTQLGQILDLVSKQVKRKNSNSWQQISTSNNSSNNSFNFSDLYNVGKNFKKNKMSNFPKNMVYPDQILDIQKYFQQFVGYFLQRFQNLTLNVLSKKLNKKLATQLLFQNKKAIIDAFNISNSLIFPSINSTENLIAQAEINKQFDKILANTYQSTMTKLTNNRPLQQAYIPQKPRLLQASTATSNISANLLTNTSIMIDWTYHAGAARYQGICGACYTFASSDAVASLYSIYKYGFFVPLSTQQVIDCSNNGLTYGCGGGFLQGSFAYMQVRGITTDYGYPYISSTNGIAGACKFQGGNFKISLFKNVQAGSCPAVIQELKYGPVSIGIAGYRLQFYSSGIFNDCNSYIDHAVVLIGYKSGVGWKIKNSWGVTWGINGFAWIADGNNCGICDMAVAPKL